MNRFLLRTSLLCLFAFFFMPLGMLEAQEVNKRAFNRKINLLNQNLQTAERAKRYEEAVRYCWEIAENYVSIQSIGLVESYYRRALRNAQRKDDPFLEGRSHELFADSYPTLKFYSKKKDHYQQALHLYQMAGKSSEREGFVFRKQAKIAHEMRDYFFAIEPIEKLLAESEKYKLSKSEKENFYKILIEAYSIREDSDRVRLYDELLEASLAQPEEKTKTKTEANALIDPALLSAREIEILRGQKRQLVQDTALKALEIKVKNDSLQIAELKSKEQEALQKEQEALAKRYEAERKILGIVIVSVFLVFGLSVFAYVNKRKSAKKLEVKNQEIQREREKSDNLLLNILPASTALELKEKGAAQPQTYEMVTVLFTDFKGFTQFSEQVSAERLIEELNECFFAFDEICKTYNLEKIKTIGDAYMCAAGVPIPNTTNPIDAVRAGLAMQTFMRQWQEQKVAQNLPILHLRLGIHTGSLVAGVIGQYKFAYDIWGDTVNTASRMESSGEIGKVNISGTTYQYVKDHFECEHRGKVAAKNKGEIDMYFVVGEK
jgi:adenylate cyclase